MKPVETQETLRRALTALKEARVRIEEFEQARREPIAIIGMGCRFPGSSNSPNAYWDMLVGGRHGIRDVPRNRWPSEHFYDNDASTPGKMRFSQAGFIDDPDLFDPGFFEISPREASHMDPQQRVLLQVACEALEDAGVSIDILRGSQTGVWVGVNSSDYLHLQTLQPKNIDTYTIIGGAGSIVANRLSYLLDLRGPSMVVDTACSTSLVAMHLACQSLRSGECEVAIAGAVNLILSPLLTMAHARGMPMAKDNRCKTFDAHADGYVRGEGCGVVVLKRLSDAIREGDEIWAVVRGSAVNQDGRTNGLTAPNGLAQQDVVRKALALGGVEADSIGYIEAHGTGTELGDPIEVEALQEVYGPNDGRQCALGSVKTNIGHLESAAGMAGLIKLALSIYHAKIPAILNFEELNPHIELDNDRFVIPTKLLDWSDDVRRGAVSSFGAGGTNAHLVLEQAPSPRTVDIAEKAGHSGSYFVVVSSQNTSGLRENASSLADWLTQNRESVSLSDLSYTSIVRRSMYESRVVVDADNADSLITELRSLVNREAPERSVVGRAIVGHRRRIVFVCSGHGSQWTGMAHDLMNEQPVFKNTIEECKKALAEHTDWSIDDVLRPDIEMSQRFDIVQPTLWAIELALASLWRSWGVNPDLVIGHSFGEIAAASISGAISLDDAAKAICLRSRLMEPMAGKGLMLLIGRPESEVRKLIEPWNQSVSVAVVNGPGTTAISGEHSAILEIEEVLQKGAAFWRRIQANIASHSPQMEPLKHKLVRGLATVRPLAPEVPMLSTIDLKLVEGRQLDAHYWGNNLREPVRFGDAIECALSSGHDVFIELSPHSILGTSIEQTIAHSSTSASAETLVLASMAKNESGTQTMRSAWAKLLANGYTFEPSTLVPSTGTVLRLPSYRWSNRSFWFTEDRWAPILGIGTGDDESSTREALRNACSSLHWVERGTTEDLATGGSWWIVGGHTGGLASRLCEALEARNVSVQCVDPLPAASDAAWRVSSPTKVIDLRGLDSVEQGVSGAVSATSMMLATVRHLQRVAAASPRLWVVTRGAWGREEVNPTAAALWGLGRTITLEHPERFGGMIDLCVDPSFYSRELINNLANALIHDDDEDQLRLTEESDVLVPRIVPASEVSLVSEVLHGDDQQCAIVVGPDCGAVHLVLSELERCGFVHRIWLDEDAGLSEPVVEGVIRVGREQVADRLTEESREGRPLKVAIRIPAQWDTCPVSDLDHVRLRETFARDAESVHWLLDMLQVHPIEHLVLLSSVAASWGSMGLGHVGAVGAYIDALARCRRANDFSCSVVEFSPWSGGDMVDEQSLHVGEMMGVQPLDPALALAAIQRSPAASVSPLTVAVVDWSRLRPVYEARTKRPFLAKLGKDMSVPEDSGSLRTRLAELTGEARKAHLVETLTKVLATLLRHTPEAVEPDAGFFALGMDSLMAVELRRRLQVTLAISIPASVIFEYPTVLRLGGYLLDAVGLGPDPSETVGNSFEHTADGMKGEHWDSVLERATAMSEQELLDELERELK